MKSRDVCILRHLLSVASLICLLVVGSSVFLSQVQKPLVDPTLSNAYALFGKRLLVAGGEAHSPSTWNLETGAEMRVLEGHQEPVWAVAFSHDGKRILTGSGSKKIYAKSKDDSVRMWDTASGRELRRFAVSGLVRKVEFSADDKAILSVSNEVTIWDTVTGAQLFHFGVRNGVNSASVSPKGHLLMINLGEYLRIVDYISGRELGLISRFEGATDIGVIWSEQFNDEGTLVLTATGNTARIWNTDGTPVRVFEGHSGPVVQATFSADGQQIVTASIDHFAILWDVRTGRVLHRYDHPGTVSNAILSQDGKRLLTTWKAEQSIGDEVSLWDVDSERKLQTFGFAVGFSPESRTVMVLGEVGTLNQKPESLWSAETGELIRRYPAR